MKDFQQKRRILCEDGARGDSEEREERTGKMVKEEEGTDKGRKVGTEVKERRRDEAA